MDFKVFFSKQTDKNQIVNNSYDVRHFLNTENACYFEFRCEIFKQNGFHRLK